MSHLSCRYIGLVAPDGEKKLAINVDGQDNSHFDVVFVLFKPNGYAERHVPITDYEVRSIPMNDWYAQTGGIEVLTFGTEGIYKGATIIPMNLSTNQDYRSLSLSVHLENFLPLCEGDFDSDTDVDGSDLSVFAADFGRTDCCMPDVLGDFDGDGDVDGSDLIAIQSKGG